MWTDVLPSVAAALVKGRQRLAASMATGVMASLALAACQPAQPPLDTFGTVPAFRLLDQSGQTFTENDLSGRVAVMDFIYTSCTDVCPLLSGTMAAVQQRLQADRLLGSQVVLVSVSVDPLSDTPGVMAAYGKRYAADPVGWKLLTGDWDTTYDLITGLKLSSRPPRPSSDAPLTGGTEIEHSERVLVIDAKRQVRAFLRGSEVSPDEVVTTVRRAL